VNAICVERIPSSSLEQTNAEFSPTPEFASGTDVPHDLRSWVDAATLARAARQSAQSSSATLHPVFSFDSKRLFHPWRMLALLGYAYATGVFSSRAIAELADCDEVYRDLCGPSRPTADLLRRFRNYNRFAVQRCVEKLILVAWKARAQSASGSLGGESIPPLLIIEILCEAQTRLQRAHQSDAATGEMPELTPLS
jgi:hypothetical protein